MGADSRLQYQNQFIATDADKITTQTANTDEILLAETTWDEVINGLTAEGSVASDSYTPEAYKATVTSIAKGGVVIYDGTNWSNAGVLTDLSGITADNLGTIEAAATANDFAANEPINTVKILTANITIPSARLADSSSDVSAVKGDVYQASAEGMFVDRGNLTDFTAISTIDDIRIVTSLTSASLTANDVDIFSAAATGVSGITGTPAQKFHPVQPLIIESSLRGGGENIPLPYKTGNSAMTKDAPGPISVEEGMVFAGTGDGMEMFYRMMTQDKNPSASTLEGQTTGEQVIIAAGALSPGSGLTKVDSGFTNPTLVNLSELNDDAGTGKIPVKFEVTPSKATGAGNTGLIKIEGEDKDGLAINEFLAWTSGNAPQKTKNFYSEITSYSSSGWSESSTSVKIACTDTARKVVYTPQDEELVAFWFVRLVTGITPRLFSGVIGNSFEASLGRDTAIEWNVSCLGKRSWPNRNIRGEEWDSGDGPITNTNRRGRKVPIDSSIGFADPNIFTGWQCELNIGGTRMALIDSTLSVNQNLENSGVITGDRYEEAQPFRGTDREVMVDGTVVYAPENNLSQVYLDNATLEDVHLNLRNKPRGGFYWLTRFVFPTTQINTNPDPASPRDGRISQTFNLKCFTEGIGGGPKDYSIETYVPDYTAVRDFSN